MPRQRKEPLTLAAFTEKNLQRPLGNIIKDLFEAQEQILQLKSDLRKVKPRKTDDIATLKADVKRLRKIEAKYRKIMEFAKNESSDDTN